MANENAPVEVPLAISKYSKRVLLKTILDHPNGTVGLISKKVLVGGWVKSSREFRKEQVALPAPDIGGPKGGLKKDISCVEAFQTKLPFLRSIIKALGGEHRVREKLDSVLPKLQQPQPSISILQISDGSGVSSLQVLVDSALAPPGQVMPTGTCILVEGILQKPSLQGKETIEVKAEKIHHLGTVDQDRYPLSKKRLPLESLRESAHFRPRTTTVASVMRLRSALTQAVCMFFQDNGFLHVQVPVITSTDCEGFGENFQVTTLLGKEKRGVDHVDGVKLETIKAAIQEKGKKIESLNRSESNKEVLATAVQDLKKTTQLATLMEAENREKRENTSTHQSKVDFSKDFFSCRTFLSVSGRLHLESYASALGNVYTLGPRFRAKRSESKKYLAEMWVAELEMAFCALEDSMECAEDFLKFICKWTLENCTEDLKFLSKRVDNLVKDHLQLIAIGSFEKISYSEAVEVLKKLAEKKIEAKVEWGSPLSEEHERYLTDEIYKKPVIIYNYPKELKPFCARLNDDGKTAAAFNVIIPKVGTLMSGSQNDERFNTINARIKESGLEKQQYEWYLDLRRHGAVKCSGFSFYFDPLVLYATGLNDARDAVPFPRSLGKANN